MKNELNEIFSDIESSKKSSVFGLIIGAIIISVAVILSSILIAASIIWNWYGFIACVIFMLLLLLSGLIVNDDE